MLKKFVFSFIVSLVLLLSVNMPAFASDSTSLLISGSETISDNPMDILSEFTEKYPNRTAGTNNELLAANYLADILKKYNLSTETDDYLQKFSVEMTGVNNQTKIVYSQNVRGTYLSKNQSGKKVVIGAHYDSVYEIDEQKKLSSSGSYDNASGVTAALMLLDEITKSEYDFDIEFVFFGSEEIGLIGSRSYLSSMSDSDKDNILLMVNLDSIICGDYLYLYTNEKPMPHQEMFFNEVEQANLNIRQVPKDKRITSFGGLMYKPFSHVGQMTDSEPFVNAQIPVLSLFGYNMESVDRITSVESDSKSSIMHTLKDNLSTIVEKYKPDFVVGRLNDATSIVLNTISRSDFVANMEFSKANSSVNLDFYNIKYNALVLTACLLLFVAVMVIMVAKVSKEKPEELKSEHKDVFEFMQQTQSTKDIYVFGEEFEDKNKKK